MTDRDNNTSDNPGDNPREAQREAKELKPNQDSGGERSDILGREFESTDERELESRDRQHSPLTDPEDNALVNRVVSNSHTARPIVVRQPQARSYLMSPAALRNLFVGSSVAGVALIVVILTLASSGDQARYTPADETQYQRTLLEATESITATGVSEGGTARIPIEEAITVVAAQGLGSVNASLAAPLEQPAQAEQDQKQTEQAQPEQAQAAPAQPKQPAQAQTAVGDTAAGQAVYEANCASCHQVTGAGVPGAFPPLVGHVPALYNSDRSYLITLLLYGLQGEIQVKGQTYNGVMPAWQQLSDDDIAGVLNYVSTAWGNEGALAGFRPYKAGEIAAVRDAALSSDEVYALRQKLGLSGDE